MIGLGCPFGWRVPRERASSNAFSCGAGTGPGQMLGAVRVTPVGDVHHGYDARLVVDPVDDSVCATACAEPVVQWGQEALSDAVGLPQQRAGDELVRCGGYRFGKGLAEGSADGRGTPQVVGVI